MWRTALALIVLAGCNPGDGDGGAEGDGSVAMDGGVIDARLPPIDGSAPLTLTLEVGDGECADLAIADRDGAAVRFTIAGRANAPVQLWAEKPTCAVEPFVYQDVTLDDAGRWVLDLRHGGGATCTENLLGGWRVWAVMGSEETAPQELTFASGACGEAATCASAATFCPEPSTDEPLLPKDSIFVLSDRERPLFTPPDPSWLEWRTRYEDFPLRALYEAFDEGRGPDPMPEDGGEAGWLEPDGGGSRNHGPLWMGESALGHAFAPDPVRFDAAAENCITILELDDLQGHMRDESVGGYAGFWEGAVAAMALAAMYAPEGSSMGPALLAKARDWWDDHIGTLRRLSTDDGQVMLIGARTPSVPGETDSWSGLSAALNLQLVDRRPHDQLHPTLAALITAEGEPAAGMGGVPIRWYRPRHVAERWVMLRAVQSGAIRKPPADEPGPELLAQTIYRWEAGGRTHVATPEVRGLGPCRWKMSWAPGQVVRVDVGNTADTAAGGRGPHAAPEPLGIPAGTPAILGGP